MEANDELVERVEHAVAIRIAKRQNGEHYEGFESSHREAAADYTRAALAAIPDGREAAIEECAKVADWRGEQFAALIAGGKGEHGKPGYVRDSAWLSWMEKREMCRELSDRIRALKTQPQGESV